MLWIIQKTVDYFVARHRDREAMRRRVGEEVARKELLPDLEEIDVTLRKFAPQCKNLGELDEEMRRFMDDRRLRLLRHVELIPDEDFRDRLTRIVSTFNDARLIELHSEDLYELSICMTLMWEARAVINAYLLGDRLPELSDRAFEVFAVSTEARQTLDLPSLN